ncbi:MAG: riboflavin biosynthesis protein RibF [Kiritimatiellales bacterium]|nr:riboflavin biosynthesis protein RibF [Kiritimatiellales bacterium]
MQLVKHISEMPQTDKPVVLATGCFDGVHIGHQKVISTAVEQAEACGGEAWIYTFNPHPAKILVPDKAPPLISAPPCRMRQFETLGVHGIIEIPFDMAFAQIEPEEFLSNLWKNIPSLSGIVCGIDWSFGRRAAGKFQTLETFCNEHALTATAVHPVLYHGEKVSSTHIRKAIQTGHIPLAEQMLGRPFSLFGTVIPGNKIGRELGYPTANINPLNELLPGPGVYAAYTKVQSSEFGVQNSANSELHPSAVFIGKRETFGCHMHVIESYLLDFDGDLYGQIIEICLVEKTRDVHPFPSKKALIEQIKKDVVQIRRILAGKN